MLDCCSYKLAEIDRRAESGDKQVTVYRMGTHLDIVNGFLVSNANHIGRFNVTAVSNISVLVWKLRQAI